MKFNRLLERQVRKFLPEEFRELDDIQKLLNAVNDSYNSYERDNELSERAFKISEEEYMRVNEEIKKEATLKEISIAKLKEAIAAMDESEINPDNEDLLDIVAYLETQITKRKKAENELLTTANRLSSLIMNIQAGVLVEDHNRHIALTNQLFCDMFGIPARAESLIGMDCADSAEQSKALFKDPEEFVTGVDELVKNRKLVINEELELADGRFFERDYIPIFIDNIYSGHFWKYRDITEKKKAEDKLKASEKLLKFALEGAGDGAWEYNFLTNEAFFSRQYKKMLGYDEADFSKRPDPKEWTTDVHPDDVHLIKKIEQEYFEKTITSHSLEYRIRHKNGTYIWILDRGMVIDYTPDGHPGRIAGTHADITARKIAEEELRRLSLVASANKNGVVFTDPHGCIFWCNEGFCHLSGFAEAEIIGKTPVELLRGEQTDKKNLQLMIDLFMGGENFDVELLCYRKDGTTFWGRATGQSVHSKEGKVEQFFAVVEDITTEKEAQQKLKEFENRFRRTLERIGDNVWEHDYRTGITYVSNSADNPSSDLLNGSMAIATDWWKHVHPDDKELLRKNDENYKSGLIDHHTAEYRMMAADGSIRWVLDRGVVIEKKANGKPLKLVGTHTDITDRKLSEQALRINEEKYRSIIANMNLGLLEVDNNERIQYANQSFCDISGYKLEEIMDKKASLLFARNESLEMAETKNELRKKGVSDVYEMAVKNKSGELRWWLVSGAPRYDDKGDLVGSVGIHLDITAQKNLEMELYDAREAAEHSAKAKEMFLANMSHEIRTPMNAILGMSRQLDKTVLNEQQKFFLETINKAAEHLLIVINDILDISKIEAGKLSLEQIGFKPEDIIKHCLQVMSHRAEEKGLKLIKEGGKGPCPVFIGDPYRLTQVLLNLLSNAIKFTEKGSVTMTCQLLEPGNNYQTIVIVVTDTGIGMDKEFLSGLFQKFTQEDKTIARKYGGTGLGMSICKQLVELMNGTIDVKSKKGKGTSVTIAVPFVLGTVDDLPDEENVSPDSSTLEGKRILLAEDNEMNRLVAQTVLNQYGAIIIEATNGEEAVNELKKNSYDVVLMDMQMPVMDGLEATRVIRAEVNENIPIIALTANAIKGESERCIQAGMNDFVSKPFEEKDLVNAIVRSLGKTGSDKKHGDLEYEPEKKEKLYDLSILEGISNGNNGFVKKMIGIFSENIVAEIREIKIAIKEQKFDVVRSIAHKIKPSLDNLGIVTLYNEIREVETFNPEDNSIERLHQLIKRLADVVENVVRDLKHETVMAA